MQSHQSIYLSYFLNCQILDVSFLLYFKRYNKIFLVYTFLLPWTVTHNLVKKPNRPIKGISIIPTSPMKTPARTKVYVPRKENILSTIDGMNDV